MSLLDPLLDLFRGRTITVPPLDGAFRPNAALEAADLALAVPSPDSLDQGADGQVLIAAGTSLLAGEFGSGPADPLAEFDSPVTALAALPGGGALVGLDDGRLVRVRVDGETAPMPAPGLGCPTAIAVLDERTVLVAQGSATRRPSEWARDLLEKNSSGALWRLSLSGGAPVKLADRLGFPHGVALTPDRSRVVVAESWRHRLLAVTLTGGSPEPVLTALPGYPGRLRPAAAGGWWLALFAPRNRLVEFVLAEDRYRRAMMAEVEPSFWIAPALSPPRSFLEPLQCGSVRTMGIAKPWAPSRSYGLVVRLDARFRPVASLHSRADGRRHGVTDVLDLGDAVLTAAKGADAVLVLSGEAAS